MASSDFVHRVTLFKIPDKESSEKLLGMYKEMKSKAFKDGKPYIVACEAGYTEPDKRNQGFNVAAKTTFANLEDFTFYDKECGAHKELRAYAASVNEGAMMVYFQSVL